MTTEPVPLRRMAALSLVAFEVALNTSASNGGAPPTAEVAYTVGRLAMAAPGTAARCPHVRAALAPEVLAVVIAHVSAVPATPPAAPRPEAVDSPMGSTAAARLLGVTTAAVRAAAQRGTLRGAKSAVTGEWTFSAADVAEYGRTHGR